MVFFFLTSGDKRKAEKKEEDCLFFERVCCLKRSFDQHEKLCVQEEQENERKYSRCLSDLQGTRF